MSRSTGKLVATVVLTLALAAPVASGEEPAELLGAEATILQREPQIRPVFLGSDPLDGLRYADAAEGLDLIQPPEPSHTGDAELEMPLTIPAGRGGTEPELRLTYNSAEGAGWVGTGWDLGVGEITVDTRWGVPRYSESKESETYILDGEVLAPTAVRSDFRDRVDGRAEFHRRVETAYERVIRHGTSPKNYWWEVHDKSGGVRWYGGTPDHGGPAGERAPGSGLDENAVLRDDEDNIYRWALTAERDSYVNVVRYQYETVSGERVGLDEKNVGRQLYLKRILYTGALPDSGHLEDPAYEVRFLRDGPFERKDIVVDGTGGFLEVTSDVLQRIEIWTGDPKPDESLRDFDTLSRAYRLNYRDGAFGKALLASVDQLDSDGGLVASHELDYYDDVRDDDGGYDGLDDHPGLDTREDFLAASVLKPFGASALGSSDSTNGDAHVYLGFNPTNPTKTPSAGGSLSISGGATEGRVELMDINGDQLPDKVYREGSDVSFRLNRSGPGGGNEFGEEHSVGGLSTLSTEWGIGFGAAVEGYFGVSASFAVGANVAVGENYFEDVNNDGLPDLVSAGKVRFNHLDENGVPSFTDTSSPTRVPIATADPDLPDLPALDRLEQQLDEASPPLDTVRRWVAPFAGVVDIQAPVTLEPPPDTRFPKPPSYDGDGVRVAIQRGGSELWTARLENPGDGATPTGVTGLPVLAGQAIYFRVQSGEHGALDQVRWDPRIEYAEIADFSDDPPLDVNGRDQRIYDASEDFTLAGRPGTELIMPLDGTVHLDAVLRKKRPTSDDVRVLVERNGVPVVDHVVDDQEVYPDGLDLSTDFDVIGPRCDGEQPPDGETCPEDTSLDKVTVRVEIDSPIDLTALEWAPRLYYTQATDADGEEVPVNDEEGNPQIDLQIPPDIDTYPAVRQTRPTQPWQNGDDDDEDDTDDIPVTVEVHHDPDLDAAPMTLAVKQRNRLVRKFTFTVQSELGVTRFTSEDVPFEEGEDYWFELSARKDLPVDEIATSVRLAGGAVVPHTLNGGGQGIFPQAFRGWGYAGYDGGGEKATQPIDEEAFEFEEDDYDERDPEGFAEDSAGFDWDFYERGDTAPVDEGFRTPQDKGSHPFTPYVLDLLDEGGAVTGQAGVWRGPKDNTVGGAGFARASRRGTDDPGVVPQPGEGAQPVEGAGARGVRKVGITAPTFSLTAGIGPLSASFAGAPSFGLLDYTDMNGDGFPDIVAPGYIRYTGPRGGFESSGDGVEIVAQDVTLGVGGGFTGSTGKVKANSEGQANSSQGNAKSSGSKGATGKGSAATKGGPPSKDEYGFSIGGSFGIEAQFTNPGQPILQDEAADTDLGPVLEKEFSDVNGDGLPDQVEADFTGITVRLNTGYGFSEGIRWAGGGFEAGEAYSGTLGASLGFQWNKREIAAGLSYTEGVSFPRYAWIDVDGDGVLDRLRKDGTDIRVAFGTGAGIMSEVDYGDFTEGSIDLAGDLWDGAAIPVGQQIAQTRARGLAGGADFTFGIGPLCTLLCYIVVNPGVHVDHSASNEVVEFSDVNGDGYPDSLTSNTDSEIDVKLNKRGRTNLLRSVENPLGGEIRLGYERKGNTVDQPFSQWALSRVEADDGRPGDGPDSLVSTFEYSDGRYDPLEREDLGYGKVVEHQRTTVAEGNRVLRTIERRYRNSTVFDRGLLTSQKLLTPEGAPVKETRADWQVVRVGTRTPLDLGQSGVALLADSGAPQRTKVEQIFYDGSGQPRQSTHNTFSYDHLGNVVRQVDAGETETESDDLIATITYSNCEISASQDLKEAFPCPGEPQSEQPSPLADPLNCSTWTSLPARLVVRNAGGEVLRERDGASLICDNGGVTDLVEQAGDGQIARTQLAYDDWGNFAHIEYPADSQGRPLVVDYVFDDHNHTNIASSTEDRGGHTLTATATYDRRTGFISSRTDVNGQQTTYSYDAAGRLSALTAPSDQGAGEPTISFEYHPTADDYAYAIARHRDAFRGDPIETVSFLDGRGRETQTKQDATIHRGLGLPPADVKVVAGAVEFDALGRPVKEWFPIEEPLGQEGAYNRATALQPPTVTSYSLSDLVTKVVRPSGATTRFAYGFGGEDEVGVTALEVLLTDAEGKQQRSYSDARRHVLAVHDGTPALRTRYRYDAMGQLVETVDNGGAATTHSYDLLGRRTSTHTPDGGLVEQRFDPASNLIAKVTPKLRSAGQEIGYAYDRDRLLNIDYPDGTPDVHYTYGDHQAGGNGVARVVRVQDGARDQHLTYNARGDVAGERSTMLVHNLNDNTEARVTYETQFTYDAFGRLRELTYPDGELLRHEYDSAGLLRRIAGHKAGHDYGYLDALEYDVFSDRRLQRTGNGAQTTYDYDPLTRRLARQTTLSRGKLLQNLAYTHDGVGNVTRVDNQVPLQFGEPNFLLGGSGSTYGGPATQTFGYDPYYRLTSAEGTYSFAPNKRRDYAYRTSYDAHGNTVTKTQSDTIATGGGKGRPQHPTTYDLGTIPYQASRPHQIERVGSRVYSYDDNGNFAGWADTETGQRRTATWDAADRMATLADQGSTTTYTYDGDGELAIERGPGGEKTFVNRWYTVRNATERTKYVWAGDERLASQIVFDGGEREFKRYFTHDDLQGTANVVTDDGGLVFQNLLHFPFGELWVTEQSDEHRTPYHYAGGYFDEVRSVTNLGARWYEPREQIFYSPDPVLADDPEETVDDPALLPAYSYAESNPIRLADRGGRASVDVRSALRGHFGETITPRPPGAVQAGAAQEAGAREGANLAAAALAAAQGGSAGARQAADLASEGRDVSGNSGPRASAPRGISPPALADDAEGGGDAQRGSRLWVEQPEKTLDDRITAITDLFDQPLIEIEFKKVGDGGWKLSNVNLAAFAGPQLKLKNVVRRFSSKKAPETKQEVQTKRVSFAEPSESQPPPSADAP